MTVVLWTILIWMGIGVFYLVVSAPFNWKWWRPAHPKNKDIIELIVIFALFGPLAWVSAAWIIGKKRWDSRRS